MSNVESSRGNLIAFGGRLSIRDATGRIVFDSGNFAAEAISRGVYDHARFRQHDQLR
jgi:hypothetical protein